MLPLINERDIDEDVIWVTAGANRQALLLSRRGRNGQVELRYLPISNLTQDANGRLQFKEIEAGKPDCRCRSSKIRISTFPEQIAPRG